MTLAEAANTHSRLQHKAYRLVNDYPYFAKHCLRIKNKSGEIVKFELNDVQRKIHAELEAQLKEEGRVRALILKARQPGVSTYTEGRYFHKITTKPGKTAYILTHRQEATDNIFEMAQRFYNRLPEPLKPPLKSLNTKELVFEGMDDSGIQVATAGAKGAGRSGTIQFFHGSEVAHWTNASDHMAGVMEAVPSADGTEVILESTANGVGGVFYDMCKAAERGESDYRLIFVPWFIHAEYRRDPPETWEIPEEFREYQDLFQLTLSQLYWAYRKNLDLAVANKLDPERITWVFRQEYPATASEAFQTAEQNSFISPAHVLRARKAVLGDQSDFPLLLGVDIAHGGKAKTRIVSRQGRCAGHLVDEKIHTQDTMEIVGRIGRLIMRHNPDAVFIDSTGNPGVYDRCRELGYTQVHSVNFGSAAYDDRYANKRAEMFGLAAEWFEGGADIPDSDEWQTEMCGVNKAQDDSLSRIKAENKKDAVKRVGITFDLLDAFLTTFAEPVKARTSPRGALASMRQFRPARANNKYNPLRRWKKTA